jgi:hypothetical protein
VEQASSLLTGKMPVPHTFYIATSYLVLLGRLCGFAALEIWGFVIAASPL